MLFFRTWGIRYYKSYSYKTPARMSDRGFAFDKVFCSMSRSITITSTRSLKEINRF